MSSPAETAAALAEATERGWLHAPAMNGGLRAAWLERCKADGRPCVHVLAPRPAFRGEARVSVSLDLSPVPHLRFSERTRRQIAVYLDARVMDTGAAMVEDNAVLLNNIFASKADEVADTLLKMATTFGAAA